MDEPSEDIIPNGLPVQCEVGSEFTVFISNDEPSQLIHVRSIVDGRAVVRSWSRGKSRWTYEVYGPGWFLAFGSRIRWRKKVNKKEES